MSEHVCYLCRSKQYNIRPGKVRDKPEINILECNECGLVYLSTFEHIKSNHYELSGIHNNNKPDVDNWLRGTQLDDKRRYDFVKNKVINKRVLDFGCGVGGFIELAKISASKIAGIELEIALQPSFKERELIVFPNLHTAKQNEEKWDLITAFHVVEHLDDPINILMELSTLLTSNGEMIIEVPNSDDALLTLYNNQSFQEFTYWSQHLYLFNVKTLNELVKKANLKVNWVKHVQRYPLSNHLYWMANGKPGGHQKWNYMNNQELDSEYESMLASIGKTDTIIAGVSL